MSGAVEPVPFETVARAVWVLTRADIARLPVRSIDDLLRFAASVEVRARGARLQSDFSIRGGSFGQTLVLLDGVRMNDAQSGHHNSDVPLTLDDIERVEVLMGAGSSLFGADAFGGTVNIITREASGTATAHAYAGEHGLGGGRVSVAMGAGAIRQAFSLDAARSSGFEYDRDFDTIAATSRTAFGRHTRALVGVVAKDFGANGFYGPAPSRETTDQVVAALTHGFAVGGWRASAQGMYRTHGDRFLYDQRQAAAVANEHRTQALSFVVRGSRALGSRTVANRRRRNRRRLDSLEQPRRSFVRPRQRLRRVAAAGRHAPGAAAGPPLRPLFELRRRDGRRQRDVVGSVEPVGRGQADPESRRQPPRIGRARLPRSDVYRAVLPRSQPPGAEHVDARAWLEYRGRRRLDPRHRTSWRGARCSFGATAT